MPKSPPRRRRHPHPNFGVPRLGPDREEDARNIEFFWALYEQAIAAKSSPEAPPPMGWGVPDWKDERGYPTEPSSLDDWEWRWEFLRRNYGYRQDWLRSDQDYNGAKAAYFERAYELLNIPDPRRSVASINRGDQHPDFDENNPLIGGFHTQVTFEDSRIGTQHALPRDYKRLYLEDARSTTMLLKIHLDRALTPQFKRLEAIAREAQSRWMGQGHFGSRELWSRHLRLLDARDAGASYSEIAEVLLPTTRDSVPTKTAARDLVKAAEIHRQHWLR